MTQKIEDTIEAWETGALGRDPEYQAVAPISKEEDTAINEAFGLKAISIRLENELIEDFKFLAQYHGIKYQTLMRQSLKRFAEGEMKRVAIELYKAKQQAEQEAQERKVA